LAIRSPIPEWWNRGGAAWMTAVSRTTPYGIVAFRLRRRPPTVRLAPGAANPSFEIAVGTATTGSPVRKPAYFA